MKKHQPNPYIYEQSLILAKKKKKKKRWCLQNGKQYPLLYFFCLHLLWGELKKRTNLGQCFLNGGGGGGSVILGTHLWTTICKIGVFFAVEYIMGISNLGVWKHWFSSGFFVVVVVVCFVLFFNPKRLSGSNLMQNHVKSLFGVFSWK